MDAAGHNRSPEEVNRRYTLYLIVVALAGWALASYDLNLLVLTIPDIAAELKLSGSLVGSLVFFVSAAQFVVTQNDGGAGRYLSARACSSPRPT